MNIEEKGHGEKVCLSGDRNLKKKILFLNFLGSLCVGDHKHFLMVCFLLRWYVTWGKIMTRWKISLLKNMFQIDGYSTL